MMRDAAIAALDKVTTVGGEGKLHHSSVVTLGSCSSNLVQQVRPGGFPSFLPSLLGVIIPQSFLSLWFCFQAHFTSRRPRL